MKTISELHDCLSKANNKRIAVVNAQDLEVMTALKQAQEKFGISAILLGDEKEIRAMMEKLSMSQEQISVIDYTDDVACAEAAVKLIHEKQADILMKGYIDSKILLKAVLHPEFGLRVKNRLIATVAVMEIADRFLLITDPGFTMLPDLSQKKMLVEQTVEAAQKLGVPKPKVAVISAAEVVNKKMISSVEADLLKEFYGDNTLDCIVEGPLSLDIAISQKAAVHKHYRGAIQGDADILLMPSLEAGNILYKSMVHFAHIPTGGIVTGASAPIVFTSRSDDAETKLNTIAFACALAGE